MVPNSLQIIVNSDDHTNKKTTIVAFCTESYVIPWAKSPHESYIF